MEDADELKTAMDELIRKREYVAVREGIARAIEDLRQTGSNKNKVWDER